MRFGSLIWKNLARRRVRSALTSLGIAIAVGTMIALLGISDGFERTSRASFEQRGVDLVIVEDEKPDQLSSNLDEKIADKIRALPGIKGVNVGLIEIVTCRPRGSDVSVVVQGWEPSGFLVSGLEMVDGRRLTESDKRCILVGEQLAKAHHLKVGDKLDILSDPYTIVGVYRSGVVFESGAIVAPLKEVQTIMGRQGRVTGFSVMLDDSRRSANEIESAKQAILGLRNDKGQSYRLAVRPTKEYVDGSMHIQLAHAMAWMTSVIAVVIGSVGMLNTMMMQVFERTREIGVLRAIGWRKSRVVTMILSEAVILSLAGALLGGFAALAIIRILTLFPTAGGFIDGNIAPAVYLQGAVMSVLVGVLGGAYPAFRAAQLHPTEALRHE